MKFSPIKNDKKIRWIYISSFILSLAFMMIKFKNGYLTSAISCLSLVLLVTSLYLITRYEMTSYTYSLFSNENEIVFCIDRAIGKRNGYVCYYSLSDMILIQEYGQNTKEELKSKFQNVHFYNYSQNILTGEKHIIVFQNTDFYDAVIFEPCPEFISEIKRLKETVSKQTDENEKED